MRRVDYEDVIVGRDTSCMSYWLGAVPPPPRYYGISCDPQGFSTELWGLIGVQIYVDLCWDI